jgi:hypothetical protein
MQINAAAGLVEMPVPPTLTKARALATSLYAAEMQLAEYINELVDTEGAVPPEQMEAFQAELARAVSASPAERESVVQAILHCEDQAEFANREAARIKLRGDMFTNAANYLRNWVLNFILGQKRDAQGKLPVLAARTVVMSAISNPAATEITAMDEIPDEYLVAYIKLPLPVWQQIVEQCPQLTGGVCKKVDPDLTAIKRAIENGEDVPGADVILNRYHLRLR